MTPLSKLIFTARIRRMGEDNRSSFGLSVCPHQGGTPAKVGTPRPRWSPPPAKVAIPQGLATQQAVRLLRSGGLYCS